MEKTKIGDKALFIFKIILASKDYGRTNKIVRFRCEDDSYLDALQQVINHCKQENLHAESIEEDCIEECWCEWNNSTVSRM